MSTAWNRDKGGSPQIAVWDSRHIWCTTVWSLFQFYPAFLRDAFLIELNTMVKLKLLQEDTASASVVVSGIISSKPVILRTLHVLIT